MTDSDHDELEATFEERVRKACPEVGIALHWTEKSEPYLNVWQDQFHVHIFLRNGTCEDPGDLFVTDVEHAVKLVRSVCGLDLQTDSRDKTVRPAKFTVGERVRLVEGLSTGLNAATKIEAREGIIILSGLQKRGVDGVEMCIDCNIPMQRHDHERDSSFFWVCPRCSYGTLPFNTAYCERCGRDSDRDEYGDCLDCEEDVMAKARIGATVEADTVAKIVAWLRAESPKKHHGDVYNHIAYDIERGDWRKS